jgi:N-acylneuraminate cytidylyltransferase
MVKILCIILARSGSKGIFNKNIKNFKGKPLLAWSIEQAHQSKYNMRIIVSTDSREYANISNNYGAETPFLRPSELSNDLSTDYDGIKHCLEWLATNDNYVPDIVLQLRPTQPCRKIEDIDKCLDLFINSDYDSLRTVVPFEKSPFKMYQIKDNLLEPLFMKINDIEEPFNQCRQLLPTCYLHNGYIDIFKASLIKTGTISGNKIYPYLMNCDDTIDIDTLDDWMKAEQILNNK